MRWAHDADRQVIGPRISGKMGFCPSCGKPVIAKCGVIMVWHWSHLSGRDCDPWAEKLTGWHTDWQDILEGYRSAKIEVPITKHGETHRADAVLMDGTVVELQKSAISPKDIEIRESFYGEKMIWIFDVREAFEKKRISLRKKKSGRETFRWKHPRKSIAYATRKVFLDFGEGNLFELAWMSKDTPCGGYGLSHTSELLACYPFSKT